MTERRMKMRKTTDVRVRVESGQCFLTGTRSRWRSVTREFALADVVSISTRPGQSGFVLEVFLRSGKSVVVPILGSDRLSAIGPMLDVLGPGFGEELAVPAQSWLPAKARANE